MKALLLALALAGAAIVVAPTAAAEPCEVPGCQVGPFAECMAENTKTIVARPKTAVQVAAWCATQPA